MRLLAFIEAKKKSADELEALEGKVDGSSDAILDSTLDGNLDGNSESTSSENLISSQVSEIGKDELKNSKEADRSSICTGTQMLENGRARDALIFVVHRPTRNINIAVAQNT